MRTSLLFKQQEESLSVNTTEHFRWETGTTSREETKSRACQEVNAVENGQTDEAAIQSK